uniref:Uncharacterized 14.4 kDa protein in 16S rRNA region n=1 Tax=Chlamydomonas reinhardtii TaxID=3055 RepID=YCX3_CHLRE|nr:RecName: Full=Uncharacterized 14.4 kDa protein in 16S rRNA region [Chlamydomonas reinhardtii]CAC35219.1 hypothetical protein [Chlamydomonas reinhardtii]
MQGLEYTLEPEQAKKCKTHQLVDLAKIDLNSWSQENVRPKTLLGRTSKKRLTSQFWYEFTKKQKLKNALYYFVIYDITDNSILPVETLNQKNPLSTSFPFPFGRPLRGINFSGSCLHCLLRVLK